MNELKKYEAKCKTCYELKHNLTPASPRNNYKFCPDCGVPLTEPKALTLEEFEKLCKPEPDKIYKPVWILTLSDNKYSCHVTRGLIRKDQRHKPPMSWIDAHKINLLISDYGKTWLAYPREPGEDGEDGEHEVD